VDTFAPSTRLAAIDAATASSESIRVAIAHRVAEEPRVTGTPPPERASADTDDPPSQTQDLGTVLPANRVSRVVGTGTPDCPVFPEVTLPDPDKTPERHQSCASLLETAESRDRRTREFGQRDEFAGAYSPAAAYNALYTDPAFPDTSFVDVNYTQSPPSFKNFIVLVHFANVPFVVCVRCWSASLPGPHTASRRPQKPHCQCISHPTEPPTRPCRSR
jgi:hypothetical protein